MVPNRPGRSEGPPTGFQILLNCFMKSDTKHNPNSSSPDTRLLETAITKWRCRATSQHGFRDIANNLCAIWLHGKTMSRDVAGDVQEELCGHRPGSESHRAMSLAMCGGARFARHYRGSPFLIPLVVSPNGSTPLVYLSDASLFIGC